MNRPEPVIGVHDAPYWQYAGAGELRLQRCTACGHVRYPPGPVCPQCLDPEHSWDLLSGAGTLLAWTVFHRSYFPGIPVPYAVLAVLTAEGPILIGNLVGADPQDLRHDMPLHAVHQDVTAADRSWRLCQWTPSANPSEELP